MAGVDRGDPIDRFFIDRFVGNHSGDVRGRVLEIKDDSYALRFGVGKVDRVDVMDVVENPRATIRADIRNLDPIPDDSYDCLIVTQVLQYVNDLDAAVRAMKRVLKPGGTVLVTVPTMGKFDGEDDKVEGNFTRLTPEGARFLFERHFSAHEVVVEPWGNVLVGMAFWIGLSQQDLPRKAFDFFDPRYVCGVGIRATKA